MAWIRRTPDGRRITVGYLGERTGWIAYDYPNAFSDEVHGPDLRRVLDALLGSSDFTSRLTAELEEEERSTRRHPCACCGEVALPEPAGGTYWICPICGWEDDAVQFRDSTYRGGANRVSLDEARENVRRHGTSDPDRRRSRLPGRRVP